jgi:hypothetical protein
VSDPTRFGRVPVDMGGMEVQFEQTVESIARNAQMMDPPAQTDTRGEFVLTGLCARSYQLEVIDVVNWRVAAHGPVVSGAHDVIIRLGDRRERIRVAGRVLSVAGEPVAQAIVRLALAVPGTYLKIDGRHAQTGADGSFEFDDVPRAALDLDVDGAHVLMYETERLDPDTDLSQLVVTVQLEGSFVVDLTRTPERADAIRVLDADDRPLELYALRGTLDPQSKSALMMYSNAEMPLQGGLSSKLDTGTHARTLVLLKQGQEVERVPLRLVVGELTTIEL